MLNSYKKRAADSLDLIVVVDVCVNKIRSSRTAESKNTFAYVTEKQILKMRSKKIKLEKKLNSLMKKSRKGLLSYLKSAFEIRKLKSLIVEINNSIVSWVNSIYRYFSDKESLLSR